MRIVGWRDPFQGSFLYRVGLPLMAAQDQGLAEVAFRDWGSPLACDVLIGQRLHQPPQAQAWEQAEAPLKVLEYDDDLLGLRPTNQMFTQLPYREYLSTWVPAAIRALGQCDLVTVTVPHLAERLRQHTDAPIVVLPNTIHQVLIGAQSPERHPESPLRVGWTGTATHDEDWTAHASGIGRGLRATKAEMVMIGADYRNELSYPTTLLPWAESLTDYYEAVQTFHVMLAPLAEDEFNKSKSPIKALEAAALGIPTIAADVGPYSDFVVDGETGFLCRSRKDWERALKLLNNDEELRLTLGRAAREKARTLVTSDWASTWIQTYRDALTRKGIAVPA